MMRVGLRRFATAVAPSASPASTGKVLLENLELRFGSLSASEREAARKQVLELQKNDWKKLSVDEKKASYFLAYGHTAAPKTDTAQIIGGVAACIVTAVAIVSSIRAVFGQAPPHTMDKEWQKATNAKMLAVKSNPLTGISSEGYKGKGHVQ